MASVRASHTLSQLPLLNPESVMAGKGPGQHRSTPSFYTRKTKDVKAWTVCQRGLQSVVEGPSSPCFPYGSHPQASPPGGFKADARPLVVARRGSAMGSLLCFCSSSPKRKEVGFLPFSPLHSSLRSPVVGREAVSKVSHLTFARGVPSK